MTARRIPVAVALAALAALTPDAATRPAPAVEETAVAILVYHRFGPAVHDAMTVRTATFRWQLEFLKQHNRPVIPLRSLVSYLCDRAAAPPRGAVVITADDGHESVFTDMLPVVSEYRAPVTLFVYPSAISNATYAMTWDQLDGLRRTGLFEIQSHAYWHPNFHTEKRRLSPPAYRDFARTQLGKARHVLLERLGVDADLLAWPFGIEDEELDELAREAGYAAGFTIERRLVTSRDRIMALPRFLVTDRDTGARFAALLAGGPR